eukprot:jgi/Mesen1/6125/ME000313S05253
MVRLLGISGVDETPREVTQAPSFSNDGGWLLRFFDSAFFSEWIAVSYLYRHEHGGVRDYLCNRMYALPSAGVESYLFQLTYMAVHKPSPSLEKYVIDMCAKSLRISLKVHWFLLAEAEDTDDEDEIVSLQQRCQDAAMHGDWPPLICPRPPKDALTGRARMLRLMSNASRRLLPLTAAATAAASAQTRQSLAPLVGQDEEGGGGGVGQGEAEMSLKLLRKLMPGARMREVRGALLKRFTRENERAGAGGGVVGEDEEGESDTEAIVAGSLDLLPGGAGADASKVREYFLKYFRRNGAGGQELGEEDEGEEHGVYEEDDEVVVKGEPRGKELFFAKYFNNSKRMSVDGRGGGGGEDSDEDSPAEDEGGAGELGGEPNNKAKDAFFRKYFRKKNGESSRGDEGDDAAPGDDDVAATAAALTDTPTTRELFFKKYFKKKDGEKLDGGGGEEDRLREGAGTDGDGAQDADEIVRAAAAATAAAALAAAAGAGAIGAGSGSSDAGEGFFKRLLKKKAGEETDGEGDDDGAVSSRSSLRRPSRPRSASGSRRGAGGGDETDAEGDADVSHRPSRRRSLHRSSEEDGLFKRLFGDKSEEHQLAGARVDESDEGGPAAGAGAGEAKVGGGGAGDEKSEGFFKKLFLAGDKAGEDAVPPPGGVSGRSVASSSVEEEDVAAESFFKKLLRGRGGGNGTAAAAGGSSPARMPSSSRDTLLLEAGDPAKLSSSSRVSSSSSSAAGQGGGAESSGGETKFLRKLFRRAPSTGLDDSSGGQEGRGEGPEREREKEKEEMTVKAVERLIVRAVERALLPPGGSAEKLIEGSGGHGSSLSAKKAERPSRLLQQLSAGEDGGGAAPVDGSGGATPSTETKLFKKLFVRRSDDGSSSRDAGAPAQPFAREGEGQGFLAGTVAVAKRSSSSSGAAEVSAGGGVAHAFSASAAAGKVGDSNASALCPPPELPAPSGGSSESQAPGASALAVTGAGSATRTSIFTAGAGAGAVGGGEASVEGGGFFRKLYNYRSTLGTAVGAAASTLTGSGAGGCSKSTLQEHPGEEASGAPVKERAADAAASSAAGEKEAAEPPSPATGGVGGNLPGQSDSAGASTRLPPADAGRDDGRASSSSTNAATTAVAAQGQSNELAPSSASASTSTSTSEPTGFLRKFYRTTVGTASHSNSISSISSSGSGFGSGSTSGPSGPGSMSAGGPAAPSSDAPQLPLSSLLPSMPLPSSSSAPHAIPAPATPPRSRDHLPEGDDALPAVGPSPTSAGFLRRLFRDRPDADAEGGGTPQAEDFDSQGAYVPLVDAPTPTPAPSPSPLSHKLLLGGGGGGGGKGEAPGPSRRLFSAILSSKDKDRDRDRDASRDPKEGNNHSGGGGSTSSSLGGGASGSASASASELAKGFLARKLSGGAQGQGQGHESAEGGGGGDAVLAAGGKGSGSGEPPSQRAAGGFLSRIRDGVSVAAGVVGKREGKGDASLERERGGDAHGKGGAAPLKAEGALPGGRHVATQAAAQAAALVGVAGNPPPSLSREPFFPDAAMGSPGLGSPAGYASLGPMRRRRQLVVESPVTVGAAHARSLSAEEEPQQQQLLPPLSPPGTSDHTKAEEEVFQMDDVEGGLGTTEAEQCRVAAGSRASAARRSAGGAATPLAEEEERGDAGGTAAPVEKGDRGEEQEQGQEEEEEEVDWVAWPHGRGPEEDGDDKKGLPATGGGAAHRSGGPACPGKPTKAAAVAPVEHSEDEAEARDGPQDWLQSSISLGSSIRISVSIRKAPSLLHQRKAGECVWWAWAHGLVTLGAAWHGMGWAGLQKEEEGRLPAEPSGTSRSMASMKMKPPLPRYPAFSIRKGTFLATLDFVKALCDVSTNLVNVFQGDRHKALKESLAELNGHLAVESLHSNSGVCFPMGKGLSRIVHVPEDELLLLNSRDKVPFMLFAEVLRCDPVSERRDGQEDSACKSSGSGGIPLANGDAKLPRPPPWALYMWNAAAPAKPDGASTPAKASADAVDLALAPNWGGPLKVVDVALTVKKRRTRHSKKDAGNGGGRSGSPGSGSSLHKEEGREEGAEAGGNGRAHGSSGARRVSEDVESSGHGSVPRGGSAESDVATEERSTDAAGLGETPPHRRHVSAGGACSPSSSSLLAGGTDVGLSCRGLREPAHGGSEGAAAVGEGEGGARGSVDGVHKASGNEFALSGYGIKQGRREEGGPAAAAAAEAEEKGEEATSDVSSEGCGDSVGGEWDEGGGGEGEREGEEEEEEWVAVSLVAVPGMSMDDVELMVDQQKLGKEHRRVPSGVAIEQVRAATAKGQAPPGLPTIDLIAGTEAKEEVRAKYPLGERWAERKARIRKASKFGSSPDWDLKSMIVKSGDDCRQEHLAVQLVSHFSDIFVEAGLPLWLRPYEVLVTSSNTALIETITDAVSIHTLKGRNPEVASLRDYFRSHFSKGGLGTPSLEQAQRNFVESMAGYSVLCYLLQLCCKRWWQVKRLGFMSGMVDVVVVRVKDRHNGNILIDEEGHLIHIDFGFMLSNSPGGVNFENAPFKLTRELLEVMDSDPEGTPSEAFDYFKVLCIQGFLTCRKHAERILLLVEMMQYCGCPCFNGGASVMRNLRKRFRLTLTEEQCVSYVLSLINSSLDAWRTRQYDYYQRVLNGIL